MNMNTLRWTKIRRGKRVQVLVGLLHALFFFVVLYQIVYNSDQENYYISMNNNHGRSNSVFHVMAFLEVPLLKEQNAPLSEGGTGPYNIENNSSRVALQHTSGSRESSFEKETVVHCFTFVIHALRLEVHFAWSPGRTIRSFIEMLKDPRFWFLYSMLYFADAIFLPQTSYFVRSIMAAYVRMCALMMYDYNRYPKQKVPNKLQFLREIRESGPICAFSRLAAHSFRLVADYMAFLKEYFQWINDDNDNNNTNGNSNNNNNYMLNENLSISPVQVRVTLVFMYVTVLLVPWATGLLSWALFGRVSTAHLTVLDTIAVPFIANITDRFILAKYRLRMLLQLFYLLKRIEEGDEKSKDIATRAMKHVTEQEMALLGREDAEAKLKSLLRDAEGLLEAPGYLYAWLVNLLLTPTPKVQRLQSTANETLAV